MPLHWRPVGPEPESTYWLRRAVLAAVVVLLLVLIVALVGGGDDPDRLAGDARPAASASPSAGPTATASPSGSASPSAAATPSTSPTATPSGSPAPTPSGSPGATPSAGGECATDALTIEPAAEGDSFSVGSSPRLSLTITNTGSAPCTRDLGQAQVELVVTSGSDRVWSSDDCAPGGEPDVVTLAPGEPVSQRVTWNGLRSRPGCAGDKARAQAGTYRVSGRVGSQRADGDTFVLTG